VTTPREWSGQFTEIYIIFDAFSNVLSDAQIEKDHYLSITSVKVDIITQVSSAGQCCAHSGWDDIIHNIHQWRQCASLPKDT
jgi:hypothetical protein